jgi:hypothetical protein
VASLDKSVIKFIADAVGKNPNELGYETTLLGDCGLDGDDAEEFFAEFARQFQIDMTEFRFQDFFGSEGMPILGLMRFIRNIIGNWRGKDPHEVGGVRPITVHDMLRAVRARKWKSDPSQYR